MLRTFCFSASCCAYSDLRPMRSRGPFPGPCGLRCSILSYLSLPKRFVPNRLQIFAFGPVYFIDVCLRKGKLHAAAPARTTPSMTDVCGIDNGFQIDPRRL